jgi:uncharacterized membrane protein
VRREFDHQIVDYANGKPLEEMPGVSFRKNGGVIHNPEGGYIENLDALPWVTKVYKRDLDIRRYNVPFLLNPFVSLLHLARLPGAVHVLPVAADALRPSLAPALGRRRRQRGATRSENFPGLKEIFFDDDTFNYRKDAHHRTLQEAEAAELHLVLHVARHHRLRHAQGDEGRRLPADDRRLRIRRPADPQEHQEGRHVEMARASPRTPTKLGLTIHGDFIVGLPGETARASAAPSTSPSELDTETIQVSIAHPYPGTEFYDYVKQNGLITIDSMTDETGPPAAQHHLPGPRPRRTGGLGGALLRRVLLPPEGRVAGASCARRSSTATSARRLTRKRASTWRCARSARSSFGPPGPNCSGVAAMKWLFVAIVVAATTAADLLQSWEARRQGEVKNLSGLAALFRRLPILLAVGCMAVSFFAFLQLLRIADLSFAVPATAASLVLETILARLLLREPVEARRWAGALLVACGVVLLEQ